MNEAVNSLGLSALDGAAIVGYFLLMGVLGILTRRNRTFKEFALGRQSIPAMMIFASLAATIVGPGFSFGFTTKGYETGFLFFFLCVTYAFQTIVTGVFLAPRLTRMRDCATLGDVMNKRYGKFAQFLTGVLSVGLLVGFTAIMGKIGGSMLHAITDWPLTACLILVTGTTALLTFAGGLRATIATEAMQFTMFSIIVPVVVLLAIWNSPVSVAEHAAKGWELTASGYEAMSALALFGIAISFLLGETLLPPYANRALAAKSTQGSTAGFVMAGVYTIIWLGVVAVLGVLAHSFVPDGTAADNVFVLMGKQLLPIGVYGILLAAVVGIVMSSQEAVLNSGAVAFVKDIVGVFGAQSEKRALFLGKAATLGIAVAAIYFAHFAPSIIDGLLILYSIWAPSILLPLIAALYGWRGGSVSGWLSMLMGAGVSMVWQLMLNEPAGIPAILAGLVGSAAGYLVGMGFNTTTNMDPIKENTP